ncbi:MAG: endonuclease/exonuclease/phosphatase family protein [Acidobacteria bacterium]|nr:endonuclease/exonuclease/phosphatase family protein [Acidobacteriota bacterium]MCA1641119.1 endonuclease/exonuclease/phosphatase family protein [Acidobacteriota bacterium]
MILKFLSYNIRFGGRGREHRLAEVIRAVAPDLVVFQEATDPVVVARVAQATEMTTCAARPGHSVGFISKIDVARHEWHYPRGARHSVLEVELTGGARVFGLHLSARFSKWSESRRVREIGALLESIKQHQEGFHVLAGDFNTLAPGEVLDSTRFPRWIKALLWMSGRDIRRDTVQRLLDAGYVDTFRALHPEEPGYTLPAWDPQVRLDYIFVPKRYADRVTRCEVVTSPAVAAQASDHFPLLAHIEVPD